MKIQIGVTEYDLAKVPNQEILKHYSVGEDELLGGLCHSLMGRILINKEIPVQARQQTFWHEVVHAILDELGLDKLNEDEGVVEALGKQLYGFFKYNKVDKIYKFLGE